MPVLPMQSEAMLADLLNGRLDRFVAKLNQKDGVVWFKVLWTKAGERALDVSQDLLADMLKKAVADPKNLSTIVQLFHTAYTETVLNRQLALDVFVAIGKPSIAPLFWLSREKPNAFLEIAGNIYAHHGINAPDIGFLFSQKDTLSFRYKGSFSSDLFNMVFLVSSPASDEETLKYAISAYLDFCNGDYQENDEVIQKLITLAKNHPLAVADMLLERLLSQDGSPFDSGIPILQKKLLEEFCPFVLATEKGRASVVAMLVGLNKDGVVMQDPDLVRIAIDALMRSEDPELKIISVFAHALFGSGTDVRLHPDLDKTAKSMRAIVVAGGFSAALFEQAFATAFMLKSSSRRVAIGEFAFDSDSFRKRIKPPRATPGKGVYQKAMA